MRRAYGFIGIGSCLLLRIVLQDALHEVTIIYPPLKLRVFVHDISALLMEKNKVVSEMAKKVIKKFLKKKRGREGRAQIVSDRRWEGRKEEDDCVVWLPGERVATIQKRRRSDDFRQRGNAGRRPEKRVKR